jgi:hypothetical protein
MNCSYPNCSTNTINNEIPFGLMKSNRLEISYMEFESKFTMKMDLLENGIETGLSYWVMLDSVVEYSNDS